MDKEIKVNPDALRTAASMLARSIAELEGSARKLRQAEGDVQNMWHSSNAYLYADSIRKVEREIEKLKRELDAVRRSLGSIADETERTEKEVSESFGK